MAYDVDFWYISQDACQISTDFTPFSEHEEESIYMKTSDFSEMIERFTDPDLERKAKAFDEIRNVEDGYYEEHGEFIRTEDFVYAVDTILNNYKRSERADDER